MNATPEIIHHWPELPALPPPGQPVLIHVVTSPARATARQELRTVARRVLVAWSGLSPEQLPWRETPRGPVWDGQLHGHTLDLSLSHGEGEGWIALRRGGLIGVDIMPAKPISEMVDVARHYLGPSVAATIQQSPDPALAFALAWTALEARLKCLKHGLIEWSAAPAPALAECATRSFILPNRRVATVATASRACGNP